MRVELMPSRSSTSLKSTAYCVAVEIRRPFGPILAGARKCERARVGHPGEDVVAQRGDQLPSRRFRYRRRTCASQTGRHRRDRQIAAAAAAPMVIPSVLGGRRESYRATARTSCRDCRSPVAVSKERGRPARGERRSPLPRPLMRWPPGETIEVRLVRRIDRVHRVVTAV